MKTLLTLTLCFVSALLFSQVGVNTQNPTETLDVNGTLRVQQTEPSGVVAERITGLDANGVFVELEMDDNIILKNNKLIAVNKVLKFGTKNLSSSTVNDMNLLIWPGEANEEKSIIKIINSAGNTTVTGIEAGYDGLHIFLYPTNGRLTLSANNSSSAVGNRIESNSDMSAEQYEMMELVYDASISKWVLMQYH